MWIVTHKKSFWIYVVLNIVKIMRKIFFGCIYSLKTWFLLNVSDDLEENGAVADRDELDWRDGSTLRNILPLELQRWG